MTYDLTGIATAIIAGAFSVLAIVLPLLIDARIKDAQAATVLGAAVKNALGAMQVATEGVLTSLHPAVVVPVISGVPQQFAVGVQYVLDHAGPEAARFGITAPAIADKIAGQLGLANIAANVGGAIAPLTPMDAADAAPRPPPAAFARPTPFVMPAAANAHTPGAPT